ncbi:MAG TPA: alpha/beta fold hydrolase [Rhizomicrobium sp.]
MATFIFLHGSFHAGWNWHKVLPLLERAGHRGLAPDLPGHGLNRMPAHKVTLKRNVDDVLALMDSVPKSEEVILVAHSRNGIVISQTAQARPERLKGLVYLAAYLIPSGRSMMDYAVDDAVSLVLQNAQTATSSKQIRRLVTPMKSPFARWLGRMILPEAMQIHRLKRAAYKAALYHDCPDEITELANALLEAEPNWPGFEPLSLTEARFGKVPKIYIECLEDRAVTLEMQRRMQRETPCNKVFSLSSSHSPFFSQPEKLVAVLLEGLGVF